jgi:chitinase
MQRIAATFTAAAILVTTTQPAAAVNVCTPQAPCVRISNAGSIVERDSGRHYAFFNVKLSHAAAMPISVTLATADGTARGGVGAAGDDYLRTTRVETFQPGGTHKQVWVDVIGDLTAEANETFFLDAQSVTGGAQIEIGRGQATIVDDDYVPPTISVNNASVVEGHSGLRNINFTLSLSKTPLNPVTLQWSTDASTGTAGGGTDYVGTGGGITFPAGTTALTRTLSVPVRGDRIEEGNEWFPLDLINVQGATVSDGLGIGTIVDDDAEGEQPCPPSIPDCVIP